jgi:hypothetical protein
MNFPNHKYIETLNDTTKITIMQFIFLSIFMQAPLYMHTHYEHTDIHLSVDNFCLVVDGHHLMNSSVFSKINSK